MKVLCIDDSNKPSEIKPQNWIKKDSVYNVVYIFKDVLSNIISFELKEVKPDEPYRGYLCNRFVPFVPEKLN